MNIFHLLPDFRKDFHIMLDGFMETTQVTCVGSTDAISSARVGRLRSSISLAEMLVSRHLLRLFMGKMAEHFMKSLLFSNVHRGCRTQTSLQAHVARNARLQGSTRTVWGNGF
jgi:hypothetical protein